MSEHDHNEYTEGCVRCDLSREEAIAAYDKELSELVDAEHLSGRHLNTVIRWTEIEQLDGEYESVPYVAVLTSIKHHTGFGLFGPTPLISATVCYACVHQVPKPDACSDEELALFPSQSIVVERNTAGVPA